MKNEIANVDEAQVTPRCGLREWARKALGALRLALLLYPAALGSEVDAQFLRQEARRP